MTGAFDVAVLGSGFGGSLAALRAPRRPVRRAPRTDHPRCDRRVVLPLANLLLEELADRYDLPRIRPLSAWGTWQRTYPEIGCGLKRGFTFYAHEAGKPFRGAPDRSDQLLVAASPDDEVADTHWYRPDFDGFLADEAAAEGAEYLDRTAIAAIAAGASGFDIDASRAGRSVRLRARFVIDASGPGGALHQALGLASTAFPDLPQTEGLFTHFENVRRLDAMGIFPATATPPYPADDAALHHVFDGGWIWVLRFKNGVTSAGVAATPALARELRLSEGATAWQRLLDRFPTVHDQFAGARPTLPFVHRPRLPFRSRSAAGPGWALPPSAAAFVDPLLSTGFPLTLLGILRLVDLLERTSHSGGRPEREAALLAYERSSTLLEVDAAGSRSALMPGSTTSSLRALPYLFRRGAPGAASGRSPARSSRPTIRPSAPRSSAAAAGADGGDRTDSSPPSARPSSRSTSSASAMPRAATGIRSTRGPPRLGAQARRDAGRDRRALAAAA